MDNWGQRYAQAYKKPAFAHPITAFWVPWSTNSCWSVKLSADADYFFTPTMNGCCLAISSGSNPVVTHGNYRNGNIVDQKRTMDEIRQQHQGLGVGVLKSLEKDTYAATPEEKHEGLDNLVTVIGIRNRITGAWDFYWQRSQVELGPNSTHRTILPDRSTPLL